MKLLGKLAALTGLALVAGVLATAPQAQASTRVGISVGFGPPAPLFAPIPGPRAGWFWARGYWSWDGFRYVWVRGRWYPRREGYVYERPHWVYHEDRWIFHRAYWHRPHYEHHRYMGHVYRHDDDRDWRTEHRRDVWHARHDDWVHHHEMRYTPWRGHDHDRSYRERGDHDRTFHHGDDHAHRHDHDHH